MKCPKCQYIGFEVTERCRNCGYDLSTAVDVRAAPSVDEDDALDLPLTAFEPGELPVDPGESASSVDVGLDAPATAGDLPLFTDEPRRRPRARPRPTPVPTPRAPLSVRRATPDPVRSGVRAAPQVPAGQLWEAENPSPVEVATADPTPEDADIRGESAASPVLRLAAGLIDGTITLAVDGIVVYFTLRLAGLTFDQVGQLPLGPLVGFFALLNGGYVAVFTAAGGQTIGKMAMGIRVIGRDGASVPIGHAVLRTVGYVVSATPAGLGFVLCLFGRERLALHDRLANTRVVTDAPGVQVQPPAVSLP